MGKCTGECESICFSLDCDVDQTTHVGAECRLVVRDVTDSESESDGIRQFFRNPKSDGYLKSDRDGFKILVSVQLK